MYDLIDTSSIVFEFRAFYDTLKFNCVNLYFANERYCFEVQFYVNEIYKHSFRVNVTSYNQLRLKCKKFIELY